MPHHWFLIDPDNPDPQRRARAVRRAARKYGGKVVFVGRARKNTWFALVDIEDPKNEDAVYEAIGGRGRLFELEKITPERRKPTKK